MRVAELCKFGDNARDAQGVRQGGSRKREDVEALDLARLGLAWSRKKGGMLRRDVPLRGSEEGQVGPW